MANPEYLAILKEGVEAWNQFKIKYDSHPLRYLYGGVCLSDCVLRGINLNGANLSGVTFKNTDLSYANLGFADLSQANLQGADLSYAYLEGANLSGAKLSKVNFDNAYLKGVLFKGVDLRDINLSGKFLGFIDFSDADLRTCNLIDSNFRGANLTGVKFWESKRAGWSINGVKCEYAYDDRDGEVRKTFKPGEFERLYSEQTKIVLYYKDGLTAFEVTTLPALIQYIESRHPGSSLRLRTIGEDACGASVTVAVDELGDAKLPDLQEDFEKHKEGIREEVQRDVQMEVRFLERTVKLLTGIIERNMGNTTFHIQQLNGVANAESSTVNQTFNINAISKLIPDILAARHEITRVMSTEKASEYEAAIEVIQEQERAPVKDPSKLKNAWTIAKGIITEAVSFGANLTTIVTALQTLGVHL